MTIITEQEDVDAAVIVAHRVMGDYVTTVLLDILNE